MYCTLFYGVALILLIGFQQGQSLSLTVHIEQLKKASMEDLYVTPITLNGLCDSDDAPFISGFIMFSYFGTILDFDGQMV